MKKITHFFLMMRPGQWLKNVFVFAGLLFSGKMMSPVLLYQVTLVAIAFCMVSSCVYIFNDISDLETDKKHPKKKYRSIASGDISLPVAIVSGVLLGIFGIALGSYVSYTVAAILILYIILNILYSISLKHIVLVDVFCISAGFMLRIFAGTWGVGIPPSQWLLLCGMMITLFLGFAKRRAELLTGSPARREVLKNYSPLILDEILAICATSAIITYSLYTMSPETIELHKTENLIYTVPFVIYAIFRYIYLLHKKSGGERPARDLISDPHIVIAVLGWIGLSIFLIKIH